MLTSKLVVLRTATLQGVYSWIGKCSDRVARGDKRLVFARAVDSATYLYIGKLETLVLRAI